MYAPFKYGQIYYLANPPTMDCHLVKVIVGMSGYIPMGQYKCLEEAEKAAAMFNGGALDPEVAQAALAGSMFGWEIPGANPEVYRQRGIGS